MVEGFGIALGPMLAYLPSIYRYVIITALILALAPALSTYLS